MLATVLAWLRDIRDHKWLAVRALLVGWTASWMLWISAFWLLNLDDWLFVTGVADVRWLWPDPRNSFAHLLIGGALTTATGWLVGRFHREHRAPLVLLYFMSVVLISDLRRFVPAALEALGPGHGRFWLIVTFDFIFMRLPIVVAGIWGVHDAHVKQLNPLTA